MTTLLGPTTIMYPGLYGFGRIDGFPLSADVSSPFGPRTPILTSAGWTSDFHSGIDLPAAKGTPVCAPADCEVAASYQDGAGGQTVVVRFADGSGAMFVHMEGLQIGQGVQLRRGDFLGFVGTSGLSTGDHLHYTRLRQVLNGPAWYDRALLIDPLSTEGGFTATLAPPVNPAPPPAPPALDDFQRGRVEMYQGIKRLIDDLPTPWGIPI